METAADPKMKQCARARRGIRRGRQVWPEFASSSDEDDVPLVPQKTRRRPHTKQTQVHPPRST